MPSLPSDPHVAPADDEELDLLVSAFERGTLPRERWTHAAHLVVGSHYVFTLGEESAMGEMRRRVRAYNEAVGTANTASSGYHETLTRMWITVLARLLRQDAALTSRLAFAQRAVSLYGHRRDLHLKLYSFDVVKSAEARARWIAPDKDLPEDILPSLHC